MTKYSKYPTLTITFADPNTLEITPGFRDELAKIVNPIVEVSSIRTRQETQTIFMNLVDDSFLFCDNRENTVSFSTTSKKAPEILDKLKLMFQISFQSKIKSIQ